MKIIAIIFWTLLFIVFYTYIGYGIILFICVKIKELFKKPQINALPKDLPEVTLIIAAYNEESVIAEKTENCRSLDYPKEKLKILWVCDGSTDKTVELLEKEENLSIVFSPERRGKSSALNHGMEYVKTPFTIFTDANTMLNKEAIKEIIRLFCNPQTGCVAGEKKVESCERKVSASSTEGIYWKYESKLKEWDYRLNCVVGAAGELFAIRSALFFPLPEDTILDDFVISMKLAMQGHKTAYCKDAYAIETASADIENEKKRKVRIAAGGLQSIKMLSPLLNIFKYGTLSWQYISHRVLRWSFTPFALFLLMPINILLLFFENHNVIYFILFSLQLIFYFCVFMGKFLAKNKINAKWLFVPYYFFFMNANVIRGIAYLRKNKGKGVWEKSLRT